MTIVTQAEEASSLRRDFAERLRRHDNCTYVYTYPFKGAYRPLADPARAITTWTFASGPLNIYVHIPFCSMKCSFCNLFTTTQNVPDSVQRYTAAVLNEARILADQVDWSRFEIDSLYFGGGTPALLSPAALEHLILGLRGLFKFRSGAEMAIESAPNSVDKRKLQDLRALGFRRISLGIQSFRDDELGAMARYYEPSLGPRMATAALAEGFANVNIDLIFGLPNQSPSSWLQSLKMAVGLCVNTITIYPLTLRSRTTFGKTFVTVPSHFPRGADLYLLYDMAVDFLLAHGYEQLTMATFAKPGGGCRHEANEFAGIPTMGLGVAALTYGPTIHYTSGHYFEQSGTSQIIADYLNAIDQHVLPIRCGFELDKNESQRRYLILGLLSSGVNRGEYTTVFNETIEARFSPELEILRQEGCLSEMGAKITLSHRGRQFSGLVTDLIASHEVRQLATAYS